MPTPLTDEELKATGLQNDAPKTPSGPTPLSAEELSHLGLENDQPAPKAAVSTPNPKPEEPGVLSRIYGGVQKAAQGAKEAAQSIGRPIAEGIVKGSSAIAEAAQPVVDAAVSAAQMGGPGLGPSTPAQKAAGEAMLRHYYSWMGGDKLVDEQPFKDQALAEMSGAMGGKAANYVLMGADMAGQTLPLAFFPLGRLEEAAPLAKWITNRGLTEKAYPVLNSVLRGMEKGAIGNAVFSAAGTFASDEGQDPLNVAKAAGKGALMGAGFGAVGGVISGALSKFEPKPIASLTAEGVDALHKEMWNATEDGAVEKAKPSSTDKPTNAVIGYDEDGKAIARFYSLKKGPEGAAVRQYHEDIPIDTEAQAAHYKDLREKYNVKSYESQDLAKLASEKSTTWFDHVFRDRPVGGEGKVLVEYEDGAKLVDPTGTRADTPNALASGTPKSETTLPPPDNKPIGPPAGTPTPEFAQKQLKIAANSKLYNAFRVIGGKGFIEPGNIKDHIMNLQAAKELRSVEDTYLRALEKAAPDVAKNPAFNKALIQYAKGNVDKTYMEQNHGQAWSKMQSLYDDMMLQRDVRHAELVNKGALPPEYQTLVDSGEKERYVAQMYMRHVAPEQWKPSDVVRNNAIAAISRDWEMNHDQATNAFDRIMGAPNPGEALKASAPSSGALRKTKDLPKEVREALGPINYAPLQIAHTLALQDSLVQTHRIFDEIRQDPTVYSPSEKAGFVEIPNDRAAFGSLAGTFVHPDLASSIIPAPVMAKNTAAWTAYAADALHDVSRMRKANSVLRPTTLLKHTVGLMDHSIMAGGLNPLNPLKAGADLYKAAKAIRAFTENPTEANSAAEAVWSAKRNRGLDGSWVAAEAVEGGAARAVRAFKQSVDQLENPSIIDIFRKAKDATLNAATEAARVVYDTLNDWVRLANYMGLRDKFAKTMPMEQAERLSGRRVAMSFPSGTNVGALTDAISKNPVMAAALTFATPAMEQARIYALVPYRIMQGEKDLAYRLVPYLGMIAGGAGSVMGMLRRYNGVSDAEVAATRAQMAKKENTYSPSAIATWIRRKPDRDNPNGEPIFFDPSPGHFLLEAMKGNPEDSWYKRAAVGLLGEVGGEETKDLTMQAAQRFGLMEGTQNGKEGPPIPGTEGNARMQMLLNSGVVPGVVGNAQRAYQSMHPLNPFQKPEDLGPAIAKAVGLPIVGRAQPALAAKQDIAEFKDRKKQQKQVARMPNSSGPFDLKGLTPEQKQEAFREIMDRAKTGPLKRLSDRTEAVTKFKNEGGGIKQ